MLTITRFRDTTDVIPRSQQLGIPALADLLAPARPEVRQDLLQRARKQSQILEEALNVVLLGQAVPGWLSGHPTFRALEQVAWVNGDSEPVVIEDLVKQRALQLQEGILRRQKASLPCWSPAIYTPAATRGIDGVTAVSCLVFDYDDGTPPDVALAPWEKHTVLLHTSWSHTASHPRYRMVLPLAEPVPVEEWSGVWRWAEEQTGGTIDPACKDPSRLYLLPALPTPHSPYQRQVFNLGGPLLKPGSLRPRPPRQPPRQSVTDPTLSRARHLLRSRRDIRERAAQWLQAHLRGNRAEHIRCPRCGRPSVWFWLEPGAQSTARCSHRNSCGWWGHLDELLGTDHVG